MGLCAVEFGRAEEEAFFAAGGIVEFAVETGSARSGEGGDDFVAFFEVLDRGADGVDIAGEFVAHYEVGGGGLVAAVDV